MAAVAVAATAAPAAAILVLLTPFFDELEIVSFFILSIGTIVLAKCSANISSADAASNTDRSNKAP